MVGRGFRGRIGRIRAVGRRLGEEAFFAKRAEHLVGRNVMEAERVLPRRRQGAPEAERRLQQRVGADDIGLNEFARPVDRAVDVAFGGQMHDDVGPEGGEDLLHARGVDDVGAGERIARIGGDRRQRFKIAGVGQLVDDENAMPRLADDRADHGGADEAGAAGDENAFLFARRGRHCGRASKRKGETKSLNGPSLASLSDRMAAAGLTGHSMARSGSRQISPLSHSGA